MSRLTPFDHAFADLAEERFPAVREEAGQSLKGMADRMRFATLSTVQRILADVESGELIEQDPQAADEYLTALYVAFRFWDAGRPIFPVGRDAIDAALTSDWEDALPRVPHGACYLQFQERWIWAQIAPDHPHEPLDGQFVVGGEHPPEITVLAVLGLRPERGGFSQITVTATPSEVISARQASRTPPFAPVLDGGERAGFKSVVTTGELLFLTQLALMCATQ